MARGRCYRCGRRGHWASECYARTDIYGDSLDDDEWDEEEFDYEPASRRMRDFAREHRNEPTEAEAALRELLIDGGIGTPFWREQVEGSAIVDMLLPEAGIAVEVDGGYHDDPFQRRKDAARTQKLRERGLEVIRFRNEDVLERPEWVLRKIRKKIRLR